MTMPRPDDEVASALDRPAGAAHRGSMGDRTWDAMTRSDLLEARGYPPDVIAGGNGHSAAPDSTPEAEASPAPLCEECGAPVASAGRRFCSPACR